jgi:hypothetical protein
MMASPLIDNQSRQHHKSRCAITSNAADRDTALDSTLRVAPILSSALPLPTAHWGLRLRRLQDQLLRLPRASLFHSHAADKSP